MKRFALALAAVGLSSFCQIWAASPATTDPTLVSVPLLPGGLVAGVSGYYLEPSFTDGDLDYASTSFGPTPFFGSQLKSAEPGFDWGWGANVGFIFPNTGNDINLSYLHFDSDETASVFRGNGNLISSIIPVNLIITGGEAAFFVDTVNAKVDNTLNQVDLTVGQYIDLGCRLIMHPLVGVRYVDLDRRLDSNFLISVPDPAETFPPTFITVLTNQKSDFQGIGPMVGLDASYYVGGGFGLVGHFNSALLIGDSDSKLNAAIALFAGGNPIVAYQPSTLLEEINANSNRRIVPNVDAKLGVDYTFLFNNQGNSDLTLEVGYYVSHYFNAIDKIVNPTTIVETPEGSVLGLLNVSLVPGLIAHRTSDFGISGPYATLTLHL